MALNYSELDTITREMYLPVMTDQIFQEHPILKMMKERKQKSTGSQIVAPIKHDRLNGGSYGPGTEFDISKKEIFTAASYNIAGHYVNASFDGFENALNAGSDTQVLNIVEQKMEALKDDMKERLVASLFSTAANADGGFVGLGEAIRDDNVYGGIDRATTEGAFWKARVFSNGGTGRELTLKLLNEAYMTVTRGGQDAKDMVIVCSYEAYNKIWELLMDKFRVVNPSNHKDLKGMVGLTSIDFNGVPILPEAHLTGDNDIRFVNLKHFQLYTNSERDFHLTEFKKSQTNDSMVKQLLIAGNFATTKSSALGVIKDIDTSL